MEYSLVKRCIRKYWHLHEIPNTP